MLRRKKAKKLTDDNSFEQELTLQYRPELHLGNGVYMKDPSRHAMLVSETVSNDSRTVTTYTEQEKNKHGRRQLERPEKVCNIWWEQFRSKIRSSFKKGLSC